MIRILCFVFCFYAIIFDKFCFRYNEDIEGAIVSFNSKSMRPVQTTTSLQNSPGDAYLHFTVKVDIVLFAPKPNMYLTGVCTEVIFARTHEEIKNEL